MANVQKKIAAITYITGMLQSTSIKSEPDQLLASKNHTIERKYGLVILDYLNQRQIRYITVTLYTITSLYFYALIRVEGK